jgi:Transposase DDE domain/Insertion element 4 transposase N-terminal
MLNRAEILKQQFNQSLGLPWQEALPESRIEDILTEEKVQYRNCIYSPIVTLWAMMAQVLDPDKSLSNAVKRIIAWIAAAGGEVPSPDTGAYSKARQRFSERVLRRLVPETAESLELKVPIAQQWCGRRVRVQDGTTLLMSDTTANQDSYPQHSNQKPGCGFPLLKLVVVFSLWTGALVTACVGCFKTSEVEMSRLLYQQLESEDVVLADQAYGTFVDLALVLQQEADGVFRKHHARHTDFRRGQKLGIGDHVVQWHKPLECPKHLSEEEFSKLPQVLNVREVSLLLRRRGFRDRRIVIVTTLLDAKRYSTQQIERLYGLRWQAAEVNLRHLKTTLGMEMLSAKTPEMVRKDLWSHLLAYNLLRTVMLQTAQSSEQVPSRLSLQGTRQQFIHTIGLFALSVQTVCQTLYRVLIEVVAKDLLPLRVFRSEPRVVKRRPKSFARMTKPRDVLKAALVH